MQNHPHVADPPRSTKTGAIRISVIIPTLNEAPNVATSIDSARADGVEIVVVDGGSTDDTVEIAGRAGARVLRSDPGRAHQMQLGVRATRGEILLFLHADTILPSGYHRDVHATLSRPGTAAGAFKLEIRDSSIGMRIVAHSTNIRSRWFQLPYGDQALFLTREVFHRAGGYPNLPIMEDYVLVRALQRLGRIRLTRSAVVTSDRRWRTLGPFQTTVINQVMILGFSLGVPPERLARFYRKARRGR
jgi:rSAM/selenodomain-associated transferase 2